MKIGIATDHRGFLKKQSIIEKLKNEGYEIVNYGTDSLESVDYPDYAKKIADAIKIKQIDLGILICATGTGMTIACNRIKGIRCAKVNTQKEASLAKSHNNANVIALNNDMSFSKMIKILKIFIETPFSMDERHIRRIEMIDKLI